MSDVNVTISSSGIDKPLSDLKRLEQQSNRVNNSVSGKNMGGSKQKNYGYAALAFSQGAEDFSMAGMRGVLNNIPEMLLFSGVSAGMAAAVSLLAVAAYVAGPYLFDFSKDLEAANEAIKRSDGWKAMLDKVTDSLWSMDLKEWSENEAKALEDSMKSLSESLKQPGNGFDKFAKDQEKASAATESLIKLQERLADLRNPKDATAGMAAIRDTGESQRKIEDIKNEIAALKDAEGELLNRQSNMIDPRSKPGFKDYDTQHGDAAQQGVAAGVLDIRIKEAEAKLEKYKVDSSGALSNTANFIEDMTKGIKEPFTLGKTETSSRIPTELSINSMQKKIDAMKEERKSMDQNKSSEEARLAIQKKSVEEYDKLVELGKKEGLDMDQKLKDNEDQLANLEKQLAIKKEIEKFTALAAADEHIKKLSDYLMGRMPDTHNLVSSLGQRGLSAGESNNALGVINLQRKANTILMEIARNTRTRLEAKYK